MKLSSSRPTPVNMVTLTFLIGVAPLITFGQLNESDSANFQLRIGINGMRQTGNVQVGIIRSRAELVTKLSKAFTFKTQNNSLYQEFNSRKADQDINSRNYLYLNPHKLFYPFAILYMQTNFRRKIDTRYFSGAGITCQVLVHKLHQLKLSGSLVYERTNFSKQVYNEQFYSGSETISLWRGTLYVTGLHQLAGQKVYLHYSAYWQPGIDEVPNHRVQAEFGLNVAAGKTFSFSLQYLFGYEQVVPLTILQQDDMITVGISYQLQPKTR